MSFLEVVGLVALIAAGLCVAGALLVIGLTNFFGSEP